MTKFLVHCEVFNCHMNRCMMFLKVVFSCGSTLRAVLGTRPPGGPCMHWQIIRSILGCMSPLLFHINTFSMSTLPAVEDLLQRSMEELFVSCGKFPIDHSCPEIVRDAFHTCHSQGKCIIRQGTAFLIQQDRVSLPRASTRNRVSATAYRQAGAGPHPVTRCTVFAKLRSLHGPWCLNIS